MDRLIEQSPDIPEDIVNAFVKRFPEPETDESEIKSKVDMNSLDQRFFDIKPIKIYRDNAAEEKENLKLKEH